MTSNLINGLYVTKYTTGYLIPENSSRYTNYAKTISSVSRSSVDLNYLRSCYRTVLGAIWEIFSEFFMFCNLFHKSLGEYEKRGKYLPILHEATCDNYFIVKCLLKSNVARVTYLWHRACLI